MKHTKTPWHVYKDGKWDNGIDSETLSIAVFGNPTERGIEGDTIEESRANAAFIVKAVNNYYLLIEALNDIAGESENHGCGSDTMSEAIEEMRRIAESAIKQAEAE